MYLIYILQLFLLFGSTIEATHFRGGTITWKPISNSITAGSTVSIVITQTYSWTGSVITCNNSMIADQSPPINIGTKAGAGVNLTCSANCSTSDGYVGNEVPITGYCTDFSTALDLTVSQRSDIVNLTSGAYFVATFATSGGWQTLALGNSAGWSLSSLIDIRPRSDNGLINTPPVATCISYLSIPVNVQQTIQIPVLDADNDYIRCRFANGTSECAYACPPGSLPTGTTLSTSCILTITGITAGDYYLVAVQVEDFITNTSTTSLSSISLQFLIYVYATTTCTLKPLLLADINSGVCQGVQVGVNFTMTFTAVNRCGSERTIIDIATLSFPIIIKSTLVQNTVNASLWSMNMSWIPTASQVGSQVFCAIASDNASVQSDQYCITFFVGLTSIPLCPGVTTASTTTTTTITTTQTSTTLMDETSQQNLQNSTEAITTMNITSSANVETSMLINSSVSSSTVKPNNTINLPLIIGLSLLGLALAVCCSICCWWFLFGCKRRRQRRKTSDDLEYCFVRSPTNGNSHRQLFSGKNQHEKNELRQGSSVTVVNYPPISSDVTVTRINQRDNTLIDNKDNVRSKQLSGKSIDSLHHSNSSAYAQVIDRQDNITKTSNNNFVHIRSALQDSSDLITFSSSSAPTSAKKNHFTFMKLPRLTKSSIEPHPSTSIIDNRTQSNEIQRSDFNNSKENKRTRQALSSVSIRRIKRSSSAGPSPSTHIIPRGIIVSSHANLNRITVTNFK
ncbi:unnamed protein product [Rotaria sordida]|uniref:Uncharacterized protein n=1 Tax=Rotaria sordida TaxID=392033 RepID=A0A819JZV2_9BILA|nr:unnamed protein product [Rotaria sordida]